MQLFYFANKCNVFPSLLTLKAKALPRPTKPTGTILGTQPGICALAGHFGFSPTVLPVAPTPPPPDKESTSQWNVRNWSLQPTYRIFPGFPEAQSSLLRCLQACFQVCNLFLHMIQDIDLRGSWEASVCRGESGSWKQCSGTSMCIYNISRYRIELKMEREGGRPRTRANPYSSTWNNESKNFTFKPGLLGVIKVKKRS